MEKPAASADQASRIVYDDQPRLLEWARQKIPGSDWEPDVKAIGQEIRGEIRAVALFERFTQGDCQVHLCSDGSRRWMNRAYLVACFAYPFIQLGQRRITGLVPASNESAIRLNLHFGYVIEGRLRQAMPDGSDLLVMGMLRKECRFIPQWMPEREIEHTTRSVF